MTMNATAAWTPFVGRRPAPATIGVAAQPYASSLAASAPQVGVGDLGDDLSGFFGGNDNPTIDECQPGFVPLRDNDGDIIDCISEKAGQPCYLPNAHGGETAGSRNDKGQCIPNDKSHINTKEQADEYCKNVHGDDEEGFVYNNGVFAGCCAGGQIFNFDTDECECPEGWSWDDALDRCVADSSNVNPYPNPTPPKPARINCTALYGANHYAVWSEPDNQWGCIECRADEQGNETTGLCYCKAGTMRQVPGDVNSPCVPAPKGSTTGGTDGGSSEGKEEKKSRWWPVAAVVGVVAAVAVVVAANSPDDRLPDERRSEDEGIPQTP